MREHSFILLINIAALLNFITAIQYIGIQPPTSIPNKKTKKFNGNSKIYSKTFENLKTKTKKFHNKHSSFHVITGRSLGAIRAGSTLNSVT